MTTKRRRKRQTAERQKKPQLDTERREELRRIREIKLKVMREQWAARRIKEKQERAERLAQAQNSKRPAMCVIADKACSPKEIKEILTKKAQKLAKEGASRDLIVAELTVFCAERDFGDFQRRRTIMEIAKRAHSKERQKRDRENAKRWRQQRLENR